MPDIFDEVSETFAPTARARSSGVTASSSASPPRWSCWSPAGWETWRWQRTQRDASVATEFTRALHDAANAAGPSATPAAAADASAALQKVAATAPAGYRTLALLREGALRANTGDVAGAVGLWDQVAADRDADPLLRDAARLQAIRLQIDTADPAALREKLAPLRQPDNAWHALADEAGALLDLRTGNKDAAKATLTALVADVTAVEPVRQRASFLLKRLSL